MPVIHPTEKLALLEKITDSKEVMPMEIEHELIRLWIAEHVETYLWQLILDWAGLIFKYDLEGGAG